MVNQSIDNAQVFDWLMVLLAEPVLTANQTVLTGKLGRRRVRARCFPFGLTVALTLELPESSAADLCLLLASLPEACDDALYYIEQQFWLLRRYPAVFKPVEAELLLKQQQAVAALMAPRVPSSSSPARKNPFSGSYA